jgi:protein-S-isoprenylcysteine O-methyltransferase Ste14
MKTPRIHAGELFGIILFICLAIDLIVKLWIKSDILLIPFLRLNDLISGISISVGVIMLVGGCIAGYITHEAFKQALTHNGEVKYILKDGFFKYTRHPFYFALILITLSFVLPLQSYLLFVGFITLTVLVVIEAQREERLLLELFGDDYVSYKQKTGIFIPKLLNR